jgi:hypothetical protein
MIGSGGVFISYRRADAGSAVVRLVSLLSARLGSPRVFVDVDSIPFGEDFVVRLNRAVGACDVLLAFIGHGWLNAVDASGRRRLDAPGDYVAFEIVSALQRGIPVIPVLINGAAMPEASQLPSGLQTLIRRNAALLRDETFDADAERIVESVYRVLETAELRRESCARASRSTSSRSDDVFDELFTVLVQRAGRRKRLWCGTYALALFTASAISTIFADSRTSNMGIAVTMNVLALAALAWCVAKLRNEIGRQRVLVEQLPGTAVVEPIRRALSTGHILKVAAVCFVLSITMGISMASSPPKSSTSTPTAESSPTPVSREDSSSPSPIAADPAGAGDSAPAVASSPALPSAVSVAAVDSTPTATGPRPDNGTVLTDRGPNGDGLLTISNGTQFDAVVTLAVADDARHSTFIQSGSAAQVKSIADGSYTIYVQQGSGWNNDLKNFTADVKYSKFDTPATFTTKRERDGIQYTTFNITLHAVPGGAAEVVPVDPAAIPR